MLPKKLTRHKKNQRINQDLELLPCLYTTHPP